jgi:hypothetical protein
MSQSAQAMPGCHSSPWAQHEAQVVQLVHCVQQQHGMPLLPQVELEVLHAGRAWYAG